MQTELITVRQGTAEDQPFIIASWLNGLFFGNSMYRLIDRDTYFKKYHEVIEIIVKSRESTVLVAALVEDPDVIIGYSVSTEARGQLHWVFVRSAWRRNDIAKALVPAWVTKCTHLTDLGASIKPKKMLFDPFI